MAYAHILALIDADLERLKEARLLLTATPTVVQTKRRAQNPSAHSEAIEIPAKQILTASALRSGKDKVPPSKQSKPSVQKKPALMKLRTTTLPKVSKRVSPSRNGLSTSSVDLPKTPRSTSESIPVLDLGIPQGQSLVRRAPSKGKDAVSPSIDSALVTRLHKVPNKRVIAQPPVASALSPLGGVVPTKPIYISADQVRRDRAQGREESAAKRESSGQSVNMPLTAELLMQRWIQGPIPNREARVAKGENSIR